MGDEIDFSNIGYGRVLKYSYAIVVNLRAVFGKNVILFKGCTVGAVRGKKSGVLRIEKEACNNAMVCRCIMIEDDVLIAVGVFVNFDVPVQSIMAGSRSDTS